MSGDRTAPRPRILIVEDIFLIAQALETILVRHGYAVVGPYSRACQAMRAMREEILDAAILDISIQGDNILDVAEALLRHGIPIIFASAGDSDTLPPAFRGAPYLRKPYSTEALVETVAEALQSRRAAGPSIDTPSGDR